MNKFHFSEITNAKLERKPAFEESLGNAIAMAVLVTVTSDGYVTDLKFDTALGVISKMNYFRYCPPDTLVQMLEQAQQIIRRDGISFALDLIQEAVSPELAPTVFAIAADLTFNNVLISHQEIGFLEVFAETLGVMPELANNLIAAMVIKNKL